MFTGSFRKSASFLGSALFLFLVVGLFPVNAQEVETVKTPVETSVKAANPEVSAEKIAETPDKPAVSSGWRQRFFGFKPKSKTRDKALVTTTPSAPEASEELHSTPKPSKRLAYAKPKKTARTKARRGGISEAEVATAQSLRSEGDFVAPSSTSILARQSNTYMHLNYFFESIDNVSVRNLSEMQRNTEKSLHYTPDQLAESWLNYLALAAIFSNNFRSSVTQLAEYYGRDEVTTGLVNDPSYASKLKGAEQAKANVEKMLRDHVSNFSRMSSAYKQQSYALQDISWAKKSMGGSGAKRNRDQKLKSLNVRVNYPVQTASATGLVTAKLSGTNSSRPSLASLNPHLSSSRHSPYSKMVNKALTLAALDILGATSTLTPEARQHVQSDRSTTRCLSSMKLNMYQCLAAGKFNYEEPFCVSEHAMKEMSQCLAVGK